MSDYSWRGSLRFRLTVAFGLVFLLGGTAVLVGSMILVDNSMRYGLDLLYRDRYYKTGFDPQLAADIASQDVMLDSMRDNLLFKGGLTVLAVWLVATAAGWFLAGRLLRPLRMITATAERIASRTLHQRIDLNLPPGEVKSLADSFDSMLDRLDEAFAGQGRFIANAAHELKTPIALNRTLVEVAMNRRDSPAEVKALGENLLAVNQRHERLIDSLLTLARADDVVTEHYAVDLAHLAGNIIEGAQSQADRHRVRIDTALDAAPTIGDPILLEQLIRNLIDNAIRYNVPDGWVKVETRHGLRRVEIVVTNTGAAISPYEIPALFEPFRRLTDRVGSARGSGLGLSIVRAVAQTHHGDATAAPRLGGGLAVRVTLPRDAGAVAHTVLSETGAGD